MELKQLISEKKKSICKLTCNNFKILYLRTRCLFLWNFSYGYSFQKKKKATSNVNRLCINGFCSNFYRIQNIQIIYWARVTTDILFLPDESSFPLALTISLQSGRKGEKKRLIWLLDCLFWFIPVVKMSKTKFV